MSENMSTPNGVISDTNENDKVTNDKVTSDNEMNDPSLFQIYDSKGKMDIAARRRGFFIQRSYYYDTHDEDGNLISNETSDEWKEKLIKSWKNVTGLKYILIKFHDRDVLQDGSVKPLHCHGLAAFANTRTKSAVIKLFGLSSAQNCQFVRSYTDCARYLIHASEQAFNDKKTLYHGEDVIVFDYEVNKKKQPLNRCYADFTARKEDKRTAKGDIETDITSYCEKIRNGEMSLLMTGVEFRAKHGEIDWKKSKSYFLNAFDERFEERKYFYSMNTRSLQTTYIFSRYGMGGVGKTVIAKELGKLYADQHGVHKVSAPGRKTTYDFSGGYKGELVTIANEYPAGGMHYKQFCDVFDIGEMPVVNSRNFDKPWFAEHAILTNSDGVEKFVRDMLFFSGKEYQSREGTGLAFNSKTTNDLGQIRRRLTHLIEIVDETGYICYDENNVEVQRFVTGSPFGVNRKALVDENVTVYDFNCWVISANPGYFSYHGCYRNEVKSVKQYHKGKIDVYGLIPSKRNIAFPESYLLLGKINYHDIYDEREEIAKKIKELIDSHDVFKFKNTDIVYEEFDD